MTSSLSVVASAGRVGAAGRRAQRREPRAGARPQRRALSGALSAAADLLGPKVPRASSSSPPFDDAALTSSCVAAPVLCVLCARQSADGHRHRDGAKSDRPAHARRADHQTRNRWPHCASLVSMRLCVVVQGSLAQVHVLAARALIRDLEEQKSHLVRSFRLGVALLDGTLMFRPRRSTGASRPYRRRSARPSPAAGGAKRSAVPVKCVSTSSLSVFAINRCAFRTPVRRGVSSR